jgi:hypothetical protein
MSWLALIGGALVEEALTIAEMEKRHKVVANLIAKIGLVSSKTQFASRVEAIEKRLAELASPTVQSAHAPAIDNGVADAPIVVPARGTPLWRAWQSRGALPADGANVVEAPETSRAYRALAEKERT